MFDSSVTLYLYIFIPVLPLWYEGAATASPMCTKWGKAKLSSNLFIRRSSLVKVFTEFIICKTFYVDKRCGTGPAGPQGPHHLQWHALTYRVALRQKQPSAWSSASTLQHCRHGCGLHRRNFNQYIPMCFWYPDNEESVLSSQQPECSIYKLILVEQLAQHNYKLEALIQVKCCITN